MGKPDDYAGLSILHFRGLYGERSTHYAPGRSSARVVQVETREWTPEGVASSS